MKGGEENKQGRKGPKELMLLVGETLNASSERQMLSQPQDENSSSSGQHAGPQYGSVASQGGHMASHCILNFPSNAANSGKHQGIGDNNAGDERRPINPDVLNLPDDQSLTSALENLSINNCVPVEPPTTQSSVHCSKVPHVNGLLLNGQHHASTNKFCSFGSTDMYVPQAQLPAPLDSLNMLNQNPQYVDTCFNSGMNGPQILPNQLLKAADFQSPTFQTHFTMDRPLTYAEAQDLSHLQTAWDDRHLMMLQKQFYLQQLRNQEIYQLHNGNSSVVGPLTGKSIPSLFNFPFSHHIEQPNLDVCLSGNVLGWGEYQQGVAPVSSEFCRSYSPECCGKENFTFPYARKQINGNGIRYSGRDSRAVPALSRVGKQVFPVKGLIRSKGLRSLRTSDSTLLPSFEFGNHLTLKQRVQPNSHIYPAFQTSTSFQVDDGDIDDMPDRSFYRLTTGTPQIAYEYGSLDDAIGRIYPLSKDQWGCRFLQETLKNCTLRDVYNIFMEITSHIVDLTTDPFGNYLLQKLVEVCNEDQKMCIIREITGKAGELIRISCDMHGTRVVQKVIEALNTTEQISLVVSSLRPGIMPLIKDPNGSHVIQHCLKHLSPEFAKFLLDAAIPHSSELAKDRQGCVVLQKCLYHLDGQQREQIISDISSNALVLSQHQFGNYVVQYLLELLIPSATEVVLNKLEGNFAYLSVQKYSSNVVEKCLKYSGEEHYCCIISELINNPRFLQILQDPYGNYVIQSAIRSCKGALCDALVDAIKPHIQAIQSNPYGKKVFSALSRKK